MKEKEEIQIGEDRWRDEQAIKGHVAGPCGTPKIVRFEKCWVGKQSSNNKTKQCRIPRYSQIEEKDLEIKTGHKNRTNSVICKKVFEK